MRDTTTTGPDRLAELAAAFPLWEKTKDLIDNLLDITLNYRQSGHPGGSRSKVHALVTLLLSGAMRWDIRAPEKRFGDRFVLVAGHTIPLIYCTMAVLDEALRIKFAQTGDEKYRLRPERAVFWEDLLGFRRWRGRAATKARSSLSSSSITRRSPASSKGPCRSMAETPFSFTLPATMPENARRKSAAKNATQVVFQNSRASAVTAINLTGKSGKPSSMLKTALAPGKKVTVKLRKNAGCTFTLDASFDDEAPFEPTQVDICVDKTINFTE
jgi:hypothetical protein